MPERVVRRAMAKRRAKLTEPGPVGTRIPRISRLMAFAIVADEMIRRGEIRDYVELARIGQVSRARVSQIMALLNLAPRIQEHLLGGETRITERELRPPIATTDWTEQLSLWDTLVGVGSSRIAFSPRASIDSTAGSSSPSRDTNGRPIAVPHNVRELPRLGTHSLR